MVSQDLIVKIQAVADLHAQAMHELLALSLWSKSVGYKPPHKEFGKLATDQYEELRRTLKLVRDYCGKVAIVPATTAVSCDFPGLPEAYMRVMEVLEQAEAAWNVIVSMAEAEKCNGIESEGDEFLERLVKEKMRVNRALELLDRIKGDEAALLEFANSR